MAFLPEPKTLGLFWAPLKEIWVKKGPKGQHIPYEIRYHW